MAIEIVDYVDFPLNNGGSFHSDVNVYQRVAMNCGFMDSQVGFCGLIAPDMELWSSFYRVWWIQPEREIPSCTESIRSEARMQNFMILTWFPSLVSKSSGCCSSEWWMILIRYNSKISHGGFDLKRDPWWLVNFPQYLGLGNRPVQILSGKSRGTSPGSMKIIAWTGWSNIKQ